MQSVTELSIFFVVFLPLFVFALSQEAVFASGNVVPSLIYDDCVLLCVSHLAPVSLVQV